MSTEQSMSFDSTTEHEIVGNVVNRDAEGGPIFAADGALSRRLTDTEAAGLASVWPESLRLPRLPDGAAQHATATDMPDGSVRILFTVTYNVTYQPTCDLFRIGQEPA